MFKGLRFFQAPKEKGGRILLNLPIDQNESHFSRLSDTLSFEPSKLKRMLLHKALTFEQ